MGVLLALYLLSSHPAVRPDATLTPGVTRPLSLKTVCTTAWGRDKRHVTESMKKQVAESYGIPWSEHAKYEFDHKIPRSLAGADDMRNIWMQSWTGPWNAHMKDRLEVKLGKLVCSGQMTLDFAQKAIASDWLAAYRLYVPQQ